MLALAGFDCPEQDRAEQRRAEQSKREQNTARQSKEEQSRVLESLLSGIFTLTFLSFATFFSFLKRAARRSNKHNVQCLTCLDEFLAIFIASDFVVHTIGYRFPGKNTMTSLQQKCPRWVQ